MIYPRSLTASLPLKNDAWKTFAFPRESFDLLKNMHRKSQSHLRSQTTSLKCSNGCLVNQHLKYNHFLRTKLVHAPIDIAKYKL